MGLESFIFGKSKTKSVDTVTPQQKALLNNYLYSINRGAGNSINTLQGYADEAYNPYDVAEGREQFGAMMNDARQSGQDQINAVKGGPLGRFSLASQKAIGDINEGTRDSLNQLGMAQLQAETDANQRAYGNQIGAIQGLTGLGSNLLGLNTKQIQNTKKAGLADYAAVGANIASIFK